jgi:ribosome-binding factor A
MANPRTIARLQARIQERAAYCLQFEISDPRASFITVTRVELSPDVTSGKIYYSVLGAEGEKSKAEHMLKSAAGFIQRQIARVLDVRRMPHLRWVYDGSLETASNMDRLIREARARDQAINPAAAEEDEADAAVAGDDAGALDDAAGIEAEDAAEIDDGESSDER